MLYIKAGTFIYIYSTVSIAGILAASMQCWRMVRALRSHGRCWLVVSSDEMSLYTSRSRTSSVTDRRLITDLSTAPYDQKDLCVFCRTYTLLWSRWQQNTAEPASQKAEFVDNRFTPRYNRFITSCYKSHRRQTRLRLLHYVVLLTRLQCVVWSSSITVYSVESPLLSSR